MELFDKLKAHGLLERPPHGGREQAVGGHPAGGPAQALSRGRFRLSPPSEMKNRTRAPRALVRSAPKDGLESGAGGSGASSTRFAFHSW